jgi:predicted Rossmann fold flavoprotein
MCAVQAGFLGKSTLVLEKNDKPGAKILISGGGRCNYTNLYATPKQFISQNEHFSRSALAQWSVDDTVTFFETYGIEGKEKTLGQLFPVSNKAKDVVNIFIDLCDDLGQEIWCNCEVVKVEKTENGFNVMIEDDGRQKTLTAPKVVIASGGLPIAKMGATDFGLRTARKFGIAVTETSPALVPLTITGKDQPWYEQLSGNSIFAGCGTTGPALKKIYCLPIGALAARLYCKYHRTGNRASILI